MIITAIAFKLMMTMRMMLMTIINSSINNHKINNDRNNMIIMIITIPSTLIQRTEIRIKSYGNCGGIIRIKIQQ